MVVHVVNEMSNLGDDFDWTPQSINNKFGVSKQKSYDDGDGDYDWYTEGQSDFGDFDLPRHYTEPKSKAGQQVQPLFPSTDEFCSDVELDCESISQQRSSRNKGGTKSVSKRTNDPHFENRTNKEGEDAEVPTIENKERRRRRRREVRARAVTDAAWGVSSPTQEPTLLVTASVYARGEEESRSKGRPETKFPNAIDSNSRVSPGNSSKANIPSMTFSNHDKNSSTGGQNAVLRRTVSVPLKDNEKTSRERSNSRHGRQQLQDYQNPARERSNSRHGRQGMHTSQKPDRERSSSRHGRQSMQDSQRPERERSSSRHGRSCLEDCQKPERGRSNSRHGRSCLEDNRKAEGDLSTSHHGESSRRSSMRPTTPSERRKSPKNAVVDRMNILEANCHNVPDIVRRASQMESYRSSSSRSLMASDAETAKRRDRNRERRRSMSGSRRTESKASRSLLGEDCTEYADDKQEDEMDLSSHRRQRGRPSKFEMVRADSVLKMRVPLITPSVVQPTTKQNSNSCVLTLPDVPDLEEFCTSVPQGRNISIVNDDEEKKSRDTSRSRREMATSNNSNIDRTRQRDGSRARRGSVVDAADHDSVQISNNVIDRGRCGGSYLPSTLGSSRRSEGESSDNIRSASLRDVLASAEKKSSASLSSASVPDRINRKETSSQSCSVSLPGDVLSKKSVDVRSGSRRRGGKQSYRSRVEYSAYRQPPTTMSSIRLTPIYSQRNETLFSAEEASAEFPMPVGRKELATTWWKGCPSSCRAHLSTTGSKGVCRRNCATLRRNVSILSKRMIDSDDKSAGSTVSSNKELFTVHSTCRYPNLIHLRHLAKETKWAPSMCDLRIGDDSNLPWMRFRIELLMTHSTKSTPRSVPEKGATRWVTDDTTNPRKRRRTFSTQHDAKALESKSITRRLFPAGHNNVDRRNKQECLQGTASCVQSERKKSDRQSFQSNQTNRLNRNDDDDDGNSGISFNSAQRCLVDEGDPFSTQARPPFETTFDGQSLKAMRGSDYAFVYDNFQSLTENTCPKQITVGNASSIWAVKVSKKPAADSTLYGIPPNNKDGSLGACSSTGGVGIEQLYVTDVVVEISGFARGEAKHCSNSTPNHKDIPPLSFLSLPERHAETDDDEMYEETQANGKHSWQDNKLSRFLERKANSMTMDNWKELQRTESGTVSTFRTALIDLIVAKNGATKAGDPVWLAPLLDGETMCR